MKSSPQYGAAPNWYHGLTTHAFGDYFGSLTSRVKDETYLTHDTKYIVHRDSGGTVSVKRNACLHAGAPLLNTVGKQDVKHLVCDIHKWTYTPSGTLLGSPQFENCKGRSLETPNFGIWNGYILGYTQAELDVVLKDFGEELSLPKSAFNPQQFAYMGEEVYELPYPRPLMMVNYHDGYHVPMYHKKTFSLVADCESYEWELPPLDTSFRPSYSLQKVNARSDVERQVERLMREHDCGRNMFGWADLHLWLKETVPSIETPIDASIFAVWASIYGNGYVMPELYEGGLFLAVSYLVNVHPKEPDGGNINLIEFLSGNHTSDVKGEPKAGNVNVVEFYVHKNIPKKHRLEALKKFKHAYSQSAREDDEICVKLWAGHKQGNMNAPRICHETLEAGDAHWREWFMDQFVVRE